MTDKLNAGGAAPPGKMTNAERLAHARSRRKARADRSLINREVRESPHSRLIHVSEMTPESAEAIRSNSKRRRLQGWEVLMRLPDEGVLLRIDEVAKALQVSTRQIRRWIKEGLLVSHVLGPTLLRISLQDLMAFIRAHRKTSLGLIEEIQEEARKNLHDPLELD